MMARQKKLPMWISITVLIALASTITTGRADTTTLDTIRHIGFFHDLEYEGDLYISWAGGAII
jgi:hypothetical protein